MDLILVLDTNAYSDWRRYRRWNENLAMADRVLVPVVVLGELFHGFGRGNRRVANICNLDAFLREPQVDVAPVTRRTAEIYVEFLMLLRAQGTPIPTNDIWIAALTHECNGQLVTSDRHFRHIPPVRLAEEVLGG